MATGEQVLPVKSSVLNQLPLVIVGACEPEINFKVGALVIVPPVVPKVNVLVNVMLETK